MDDRDISTKLSVLPPDEKIKFAAKVVEDVAYGLAGQIDSNQVSSLIMIAAQLERTVDGAAPGENASSESSDAMAK